MIQASLAKPAVRVERRLDRPEGGWIEVLHDPHPHYPQRAFLPSQHQQNPLVVEAFGSATPHSGKVLLHYFGDPPAGVERRDVPVVLVHGAKVDGEFFAKAGLTRSLQEKGFSVYSLTFAHNQDDNFLQAQQLANGLQRVRALSGSSSVDLVGHSKGCIVATAYATPGFREDWMTPYAGDVRKMLLLGGPNGGIDYFHRHPFEDKGATNWPMVWSQVNGEDCTAWQLNPEGFWPGQSQMVKRWDERYPLPEWDESSRRSYYGGTTEKFQANGIDSAVVSGGNFIEKLNNLPLAKGLQVGLVAGSSPTVPGFRNETAGPNDGIILVDSALQPPLGADVKLCQVLPCNHIQLVTGGEAQELIGKFLSL